MKLHVDYPSEAEEDAILRRFDAGFDSSNLAASGLTAVASKDDLTRARAAIFGVPGSPRGDGGSGTPGGVRTPDAVLGYIRRLTREHPSLSVGAGPRASIALLLASKAMAALEGRDFVTPDDVKSLVPPVLGHRLVLDPEAEIDGLTAAEVLDAVAGEVEVPR